MTRSCCRALPLGIAMLFLSCSDSGSTPTSAPSSSPQTTPSSTEPQSTSPQVSATAVQPTSTSAPGTDGESTPEPTPILDRCAAIEASVDDAGFSADVTVECADGIATLTSDTYPDHELMTGIKVTNEQIAVPGSWAAPVPLAPSPASEVTTIDAALAVAVNGVPIYDYSAAGELDPAVYDPSVDTHAGGQLDVCNGHAGRGDDYHYHGKPLCMIDAMPNVGPSTILAWALDGYPLYGDLNPDGTAIGEADLDVCNGQSDLRFGHRYHTSDAPPYSVQCLVGTVDLSAIPRVAPMNEQGTNQAKPAGTPPEGGVTDLTHTINGDLRRMDYSYDGSAYFIQYSPNETQGCYDFEMSTVSLGDITATYCR